MNKLLLHTCCGPCFLGSWDYVSNFAVTNYFYNPNIQPQEEYERRKKALLVAIKGKSQGIIEEEYDSSEHLEAISQDTTFPKRCLNCYRLRLEKTALYAKENGFDAFSTTLLVSPYQQHAQLKTICEYLSKKHQIKFIYRDSRTNFRQGQEVAKKLDIYRQKYCGCLLSKVKE